MQKSKGRTHLSWFYLVVFVILTLAICYYIFAFTSSQMEKFSAENLQVLSRQGSKAIENEFAMGKDAMDTFIHTEDMNDSESNSIAKSKKLKEFDREKKINMLGVYYVNKEGTMYDSNGAVVEVTSQETKFLEEALKGDVELSQVLDTNTLGDVIYLAQPINSGKSVSGLMIGVYSTSSLQMILNEWTQSMDINAYLMDGNGNEIFAGQGERVKGTTVISEVGESNWQVLVVIDENYVMTYILKMTLSLIVALMVFLVLLSLCNRLEYARQRRMETENEEKMYHLAYMDRLTNLPNRAWVDDCLDKKMEKSDKYIMLLLDLDNFKYVNDTFGHSIGNELLKSVVTRFEKLNDKIEVIARTGGDEYMFITTAYDKDTVTEFAQRLLYELDKGFEIKNISFASSASIGIAAFPEDGSSVQELQKAADTALNKAKLLGRKQFVIYEDSMRKSMLMRLELEDGLKRAIDNKEFRLYYQPQYDAESGKLYGFEALIRWNTPNDGVLPPNIFIQTAEETGLIIPIGKWVVSEAARFIKRLEAKGYRDLTVSVNASVRQIVEEDFADMVLDIVEQYNLRPESIKVEITESILLDGKKKESIARIEKINAHGVNICLDDFGTGYSSITYLQELPISILKIDKSFVDNILTKPDEANICDHIIQLAHSIHLKVVAEGVETEEQYRWLRSKHCDYIQGYVASRPLSEEILMSSMDKIILYEVS